MFDCLLDTLILQFPLRRRTFGILPVSSVYLEVSRKRSSLRTKRNRRFLPFSDSGSISNVFFLSEDRVSGSRTRRLPGGTTNWGGERLGDSRRPVRP